MLYDDDNETIQGGTVSKDIEPLSQAPFLGKNSQVIAKQGLFNHESGSSKEDIQYSQKRKI
jgi:hypothetical protein